MVSQGSGFSSVMSLEERLAALITLRERIVFSKYFVHRCSARGFDPVFVRALVRSGCFVVFEVQDRARVRLAFEEDERYDINIIVEITHENVALVTVHRSDRKRRVRSSAAT